MVDTVESTAPFTTAEFHVPRDADWNDALPQLLDGDEPVDLTRPGTVVELWVRRYYDRELILKLTSEGADPAITFDDAANGFASIYLARDAAGVDVKSLPVGQWTFVLLHKAQLTADPGDGIYVDEKCRGPFFVYPGSIADGAVFPDFVGIDIPVFVPAGPLVKEIRASRASRLNLDFRVTREGQPYPILDTTLQLSVRRSFDGTEELLSATTVNGKIVIVDAAYGEFTLNIPEAEMNDYPAGNWVYMLRMIVAGHVIELMRGPFVLLSGTPDSTLAYRAFTGIEVPLLPAPTVKDITASQAGLLSLYFRVTSNGEPFNIAGNTIAMSVRPAFDHAVEIILATTANGKITITDATHGEFRLLISEDEMDNYLASPAMGWAYMLRITGGGHVTELMRGRFHIRPGSF